ncbi:GNAT family N-acetyltransferase [Paenibacillus terricola]|uniref:GNAT family N-acetyltransferase n=1 Tax=Paenibacillus terricola TaxID=2763503 RepID=UPI001CD16CE7|nr:GNAT family N-acetyltransferase [Paenibacillus terricola]
MASETVSIEIREAVIDEWPIVHRIMREAFEEYRGVLHPPSGALREELEDTIRKLSPRGGAVLAIAEGEAIGSAQYRVEDDYVYIGRISVVASARGRGIGKQLVRFLEKLAAGRGLSEVRLEVRLSLPANIQFYERLGYRVIIECRYPDDSDGWYIMAKAC